MSLALLGGSGSTSGLVAHADPITIATMVGGDVVGVAVAPGSGVALSFGVGILVVAGGRAVLAVAAAVVVVAVELVVVRVGAAGTFGR